ncbi:MULTISPECIES: hypothetical protein [unclassified Streptomyces]|uniref:hypothetical protein n=1 Tax=unclassified Streptomyces TaxID=2593676 RepID=UPI0033AA31DE
MEGARRALAVGARHCFRTRISFSASVLAPSSAVYSAGSGSFSDFHQPVSGPSGTANTYPIGSSPE